MGKYRQQWGISDEFWEKVEPLIPAPPRKPASEYRRRPGGERKPLPARQVFVTIVFVLRTGIQWRALPREIFGSPSSIHRYFQQWHQAGFFLRLWQAGLAEYDDMQGIAWQWQSIDGAMSKAPLEHASFIQNRIQHVVDSWHIRHWRRYPRFHRRAAKCFHDHAFGPLASSA